MEKPCVASGFVRDADRLVQAFVDTKSTEFSAFADIWKKHNFSMIFLGRPSEKELLEFTRQIFRITLELVCKYSDEAKIGYLYLLYGLFRYQPPVLKPPVRVRITVDHWPHIVKLRDDAAVKGDKYVLFAIRYLIQNGFDFVATPTLMGPCLSNDAIHVNLSLESPKKLLDMKKKVCKIQEDVDTCFQELKILKSEYEEATGSTDHTASASLHNIPFGAFLSTLDPYPPPSDQASGIGNRRALLKAAAYNKAISKVAKLAANEAKGKKKVGRPRKVAAPEELSILEDPVLLPETDESPAPNARGKRRERLFKEKYRFLEGTTSNEPEETTSNEPEGAKSTKPEGAKSTKPEGAKSNEPEGAKSNEPEGAKSNKPEGAKSNKPEGAKFNKPEGAKFNKPK